VAGRRTPPVTVELLRAPELIEVSAPARLLYLGMRIMANDGLVTATMKQLHAAILPGDDLNVGDLLRDLQAAGLAVSTTDPPGWRIRELDVKVGKAKKPVAPVTQEMAARIKLVWDGYVEIMAKPRARLDDKRRGLIRRALEVPYTCEELVQAIIGYTFSPFHMGDNDKKKRWDDIELLLRDAQHIDAGLALYENNIGGGRRPPAGALNGGRSKSQGVSPHQRWNAFRSGTADEGGLPGNGAGPSARGADSRRLAAGADARESHETGSGLFDGLRGD
jgi:hypothetical protein